ncbi:hypothetical protein BBF96_10115 [Anoxybacter fermentans]|uniref:Uncharacterized protein n=1 Tax=Anoxybacter fermentans TaxID=1323375 RepID=A0A3S9SZD0_9FIRM|nr:RiPP maturation radical SAM C-methyltransferase [Anoxybacter fermentans]AZR73706.1 hypothetical protein BBF96_10115 [Anoxybacter fermentans]
MKSKVLLVSPPFAQLEIPSIQISLLQTFLKENGFESVDTLHLYLFFADFVGIEAYHFFSKVPFVGEMFYVPFLNPKHAREKKHLIDQWIQKRAIEEIGQEVVIEEILEKIEKFHDWLFKNIDFSCYDLIGFTINFSQLIPALYLSREIKRRWPDKKIILGGSSVTGEVGLKILEIFKEIDFIISGEGEIPLLQFVNNFDTGNITNIAGLMYRIKDGVRYNRERYDFDMTQLPVCDYDQYFEQVKKCSSVLQKYVLYHQKIPVEFSRGCWWRRCTFCNLNLVHSYYKSKSIDQFVKEIKVLSDKYKKLDFIFLDNAPHPKYYRKFIDEVGKLGIDVHFTMEMKVNLLSKEDYQALYNAGWRTLQLGVESLSTRLLKKMNKGCRAIQNIEDIKHCQEIGIEPVYNLIHSMPNEDSKDLEETFEAISFIKHLCPPSGLPTFSLGYLCPIYNNYSEYNIKYIKPHYELTLMFPEEDIKKMIPYRYDFVREKERDYDINEFYDRIFKWIESHKKEDKPTLTYRDGGTFIVITDARTKPAKKITLDKNARDIYLYCDSIKSLKNIENHFKDIDPDEIKDVLNQFVNYKLMYREDNYYLSLALKES